MSTKVSKLESDQVKQKFGLLLAASHGIKDPAIAESFFEKEKFFFMKLLTENQKLAQTTEVSQIGTFLDVVTIGLTFEKTANHVYLMTYGDKLVYQETKAGLIYLAKKANSLKDITNPIIVYQGDIISVNSKDGFTHIDYSPAIPSKSSKILGGFTHIVNNDNVRDGFWFSIDRVKALKKASEKKNKGAANPLYTSGEDGQVDEGFFLTKLVKAAIKNFGKKEIPKGLSYYDEDDITSYEESFESDIEKYVDQDVLAESESTSSDNDDNVPIF